jgi:hypothetical protein
MVILLRGGIVASNHPAKQKIHPEALSSTGTSALVNSTQRLLA